jgi:hypothetical protein
MTLIRRLGNADDISFSTGLGGVDGATYGTIAILFRPSADPVYRWLVKLHDIAGADLGGIGVLGDGKVFWKGSGPWATEGPTVTFGDWHLLIARKNTGDLKPRFSLQNVTVDTWDHADGVDTQLDWASPSGGSVRTNNAALNEGPSGDFAAAAFWANELPWAADTFGDAEIEAANLDVHLDNWRDHIPSSGWQFSQTSSSEMVEDFTLNRADETSTGQGTPTTVTDLDFIFAEVGILALSRNFLRDTQNEPGATGIIHDLSETQGTATTIGSGSVSSGSFIEVLRFWRVVDATVEASVPIDTSIAMSAVSAATLAYRWRVQRYNSAGVLQENSTYSSEHNTFGVKTQTMVLTGPFVAGDILALSMELKKAGGGGSRSFTLSINHAFSFVEFSVAEAPSVTGTIAVTEDDDTLAASGTSVPPPISGTINVTEANDTLAASGTFDSPGVTGTIAVTEDDDTLTASGTFVPPPITGTLSVTETDDTLSASGTFVPGGVTGSISVTEADDTLTASGTFVPAEITGTLSVTEADDTLTASGTVTTGGVAGSISVTEQDDTLVATGTFVPPTITGSLSVTEADDTLSATGEHIPGPINGSINVVEVDDVLTASGSVTVPSVSGSISITEADDTLAGVGTFDAGSSSGSISVTEDDDTLAASGTYGPGSRTGTIAYTEEDDTLVALETTVPAVDVFILVGPTRVLSPVAVNTTRTSSIVGNTRLGYSVAATRADRGE